jgi:hypothetical protein
VASLAPPAAVARSPPALPGRLHRLAARKQQKYLGIELDVDRLQRAGAGHGDVHVSPSSHHDVVSGLAELEIERSVLPRLGLGVGQRVAQPVRRNRPVNLLGAALQIRERNHECRARHAG